MLNCKNRLNSCGPSPGGSAGGEFAVHSCRRHVQQLHQPVHLHVRLGGALRSRVCRGTGELKNHAVDLIDLQHPLRQAPGSIMYKYNRMTCLNVWLLLIPQCLLVNSTSGEYILRVLGSTRERGFYASPDDLLQLVSYHHCLCDQILGRTNTHFCFLQT